MSLIFSLRRYNAGSTLPVCSANWIACRRKSSGATPTHYEVLGVSHKASVKEIKAAFFALSKKHHPDLSTGDPEKFVQIKEAYDLLKDEAKRKDYDMRVGKPFETRQTYSSAAHRAGQPSGGKVRRPYRMRTAGGGDSASSGHGEFTGFEKEKLWRAHYAAEQMKQQAEVKETTRSWQDNASKGWTEVDPNLKHEGLKQRLSDIDMQYSRIAWFLSALVIGVFIYKLYAPRLKTAAVPPPALQPAASQQAIPDSYESGSYSIRQLNEERRRKELQRERLRLEMQIKMLDNTASSPQNRASAPKDI